MSAVLTINRAGPLTSVQDAGRFGMLRYGISASGPMDRTGYDLAGEFVGGGNGGIEITAAGIEIVLTVGDCGVGMAGGAFEVARNGKALQWPCAVQLRAGDVLSITPGPSGNYGYLRFDSELSLAPFMGSVATSSRAQLGGLNGQALRAGDSITLVGARRPLSIIPIPSPLVAGPIRIIWGLHAQFFDRDMRQRFVESEFVISRQHDRMGARLVDEAGVFAHATSLSLVSDAIVPGDIQILGDGTPIVLLRDHQPTGGYPRIGTIITADLDRFTQLRPGTKVAFAPVTVDHAHQLLRSLRT